MYRPIEEIFQSLYNERVKWCKSLGHSINDLKRDEKGEYLVTISEGEHGTHGWMAPKKIRMPTELQYESSK